MEHKFLWTDNKGNKHFSCITKKGQKILKIQLPNGRFITKK